MNFEQQVEPEKRRKVGKVKIRQLVTIFQVSRKVKKQEIYF